MTSAQSAVSSGAIFARWFALASVCNLYLLRVALRRWHYAGPPVNHAMSRILFWAVAINVISGLIIGWFALHEGWKKRLSLTLMLDTAIGLLPFLMGKFLLGQDEYSFRMFGTIYVIFLLLRMALGFAWLSWNTPFGCPLPRAALYVFLSTLLVFAGCAPWMWLASSPQGDESHFLMLTHSLVFDHDFDVGDNYQNGDQKEMFPPLPVGTFRSYPYAFMQRDGMAFIPHAAHTVTNYRGQLMLEHDMGLPFLMVPGYALDLREGALVTMGLLGALGAAAIFESSLLLGVTSLQALLAVALFCFTTPYWVFTQCIMTDLPAAVVVSWVALQYLRYRREERNRFLLAGGFLIAMLPWLNIRFWSLAGLAFLVFLAWVFRNEWRNRGRLVLRMALLGGPSLLSLAVFAIIDKRLFDTYMPNASMLIYGRLAPQFSYEPVRGLLGILFDQSFGLIPTTPLYIAVAAGMVALWRRNRWDFAMLFLPSLGYLLFVSNSWEWHGGWNAPGRYALCVAALMTPAASLVLSRKLRWAIAILAAWSFTVSIFFTVNPYLRMNSYWEMNKFSMWVEMLHDHIPTPFYSVLSIFPNFKVAAPVDYVRGWIWVVLLSGAAWRWANRVQSKSVLQK